MTTRRPRLIREDHPAEVREGRSGVALAGALIGFAVAASLLGAGAARESIRPRELAATAVEEALAHGSDSDGVREALVQLRRRVSRSPLDSKTRVTYASLLLGVSRRVEDTRAAAFHATRASQLAPVTLSVLRSSVRVLQRSNESDRALGLIRQVFGFDPTAAANLLSEIEPMLLDTPVEQGLPETPDAWLAWSVRMHELGRAEVGTQRLTATSLRWPEHLPTLTRLASRAARHEDWAALERLFAGDRELPDSPQAAPVLLHRARVKARRGDLGGARADIELGLRRGGPTPLHRVLAGEAYAAMPSPDQAREHWLRAMHVLPAGPSPLRIRILRLLAHLEEHHGRPADALRHWQALLGHEPGHAEARRHVDDLVRIER